MADAVKNEQAMNYRFVRKEKGWYLFLTTDRKASRKVSKETPGSNRRGCEQGASGLGRNRSLRQFDKVRHNSHSHSRIKGRNR